MIKWLKCLFYGHDYGRFIPSVAGSYLDNCGYDFKASINRVCKKCSYITKAKAENNVYYRRSSDAMLEAQGYADKFNNSIE